MWSRQRTLFQFTDRTDRLLLLNTGKREFCRIREVVCLPLEPVQIISYLCHILVIVPPPHRMSPVRWLMPLLWFTDDSLHLWLRSFFFFLFLRCLKPKLFFSQKSTWNSRQSSDMLAPRGPPTATETTTSAQTRTLIVTVTGRTLCARPAGSLPPPPTVATKVVPWSLIAGGCVYLPASSWVMIRGLWMFNHSAVNYLPSQNNPPIISVMFVPHLCFIIWRYYGALNRCNKACLLS